VGGQVRGHGHSGNVADKGKLLLVPIAGPANWSDNPWSFVPLSPGLTLQANAKYVFFVEAAPLPPSPTPSPSPTPGPTQSPTGNYLLLQPMSFNGTAFAVVPGSCFHINPGSAPPYVAPTSGPLVLSGTVTVTPTCVPSPLPTFSPLPQLSIVAVQVNGGDKRHAFKRPNEHGGFGIPAVAVAGPANIPDNPWNFAPDSPGLVMQGGASYAFFIAVQLPVPSPTPAPPQRYRAVVPLNFDGTSFTVASVASCSHLTIPTPYPAATTGPLTLSGAVVIAPTCVPSPAPTGSPAPALFVVATIAHGGGDVAGRRNPADGGGGGDNIEGIAIAGPVDPSANPWSFAPLTPPLTLIQGVDYFFFVGTPSGDHGGGGGHFR
jgi:hypothetical protein